MERQDEKDGIVPVVDLGFDPINEEVTDKLVDALIAGTGRTPSEEETRALIAFTRMTFINFLCLDLAMKGQFTIQQMGDVPVFGVAQEEENVGEG